ncbi:hypothetical protein, partial [Palleronia rufa]|uniref:hypothetical protein n=1 Tax=Palleronia rufa TaxID=1530186 RepID=UPI0039F10D4F
PDPLRDKAARPFTLKREAPEFAASRRLLRVGAAGVRSLVLLVRPRTASSPDQSMVGASS